MAGYHFKDLVVWQKAIELVVDIYRITEYLPREELYSLSDQIRRAAVSVPSNIAEGQQRGSAKEFGRFLSIAKGSLGELETQLIICEKLKYLNHEQTEPLFIKINETGRMLNGLINRIQTKAGD